MLGRRAAGCNSEARERTNEPPNHEALPRQTTSRPKHPNAATPNWTLRRVLQHPPTPPGPQPAHPPRRVQRPHKAHPRLPAIAVDGYRLRRDKVDTDGKLTLRHAGRLHHIGMGRRHAQKTVAMLVARRDIRILDDHTGELLRELTLDPTRDYQPQE
jgi:hypothetical protein